MIELRDYQIEQWRDIPGYDGIYQASSFGRIKSISRSVPTKKGTQFVKERILKHSINKGYARISLSYKNIVYRKAVHFFVASCFLPNPESKKYINHKDGDKLNNKVDNLEWCTSSENEQHSYKSLGKINSHRKLSEHDLIYIKANAVKAKRYMGGGNIAEIAKMFSVHKKTIHNVLNNKYYVSA